jgi:hypothetical protein
MTWAAMMASTSTPTTPTTPTTTVSGGAGDLTVTFSTKDVDATNNLKEGEEDVKVLGYKLEADDSDISISNVKVWLQNDGTSTSEKLTRYVDEVKIMLGDEEVGSADASDFSKESDTPDQFTKSIALSNAVVKEGDTEYLYVTVTTLGSIDSDDLAADWGVKITSMRYTDGTGAIMSADSSDLTTEDHFGFLGEDSDDNITVKSSSANPSTSTIGVDDTSSTNDVLVGAFKLNVDEDSSDITLLELPISATVTSATVAGDIEDVIENLYVTIDGEEYSAEVDSSLDSESPFTDTYTVDLTDEDVVIKADDTIEVKIYVDLAGMDDNYAEGATIQVSMADNQLVAEGSDELSNDQRDGAFTGKTHTLSAVDIEVAEGSAISPKYALSDDDTKVEYALNIKVTNNGDEDIYIPFGAKRDADLAEGTDVEGIGYVLENSSGTEYTSGSVSYSLEADSDANDDADIEEDNSFVIPADGEAYTLKLIVTLNNGAGVAGSYRLALKDVVYTDGDYAGNGAGTEAEVTDDLTNIRTATYSAQVSA